LYRAFSAAVIFLIISFRLCMPLDCFFFDRWSTLWYIWYMSAEVFQWIDFVRILPALTSDLYHLCSCCDSREVGLFHCGLNMYIWVIKQVYHWMNFNKILVFLTWD
jgi:hypothetical protein